MWYDLFQPNIRKYIMGQKDRNHTKEWGKRRHWPRESKSKKKDKLLICPLTSAWEHFKFVLSRRRRAGELETETEEVMAAMERRQDERGGTQKDRMWERWAKLHQLLRRLLFKQSFPPHTVHVGSKCGKWSVKPALWRQRMNHCS